MLQGGNFNPNMFMQQFGNNPLMQQAQKMTAGKTPDQIANIVSNIAQQKNIDMNQLRQIAQMFGLKL